MTISLAADEVIQMPVDALALHILRDVDETNEWNSYNWMNARQQSPEFSGRTDALRAFEEAWAWLRAKALVAHDPSQSHEAAIFITRRGHQALQDGLALTRAEERLDVDPHPRIAQTVRSQFLLGEYELAALAAFREVEIRVRELAGFGDETYGIDLMRRAFGPNGPLSDAQVSEAERSAVRELYTGAYGAFRNPASHRTFDLGDITMASEVILLADLLLRMLDRVEQRLGRQKKDN
jgi:uncharacterized protein (TIGR02391 family)